ncbi:MAG TPA: transposase [Epulopiscium sp.]|nr:transposase [Candidatus Epulonipiscium sp.]
MPRIARVTTTSHSYHIMVRSIKELELFKEDEDKIKYFQLIEKSQLKYGFKVYSYCLMNNHGHLIIDPAGADISKVMHVINFSYAKYFNKKYNRYGHVFQDRFKSKIIDTERYMITLSAYIHNNPKDIPGYEKNVQDYPFSSFKDYLKETDTFKILDRPFLEDLIGFKNKENRNKYASLVQESTSEEVETEVEFVNPETEYYSHKKIIVRHRKPNEVIKYVSNHLKQNPQDIHVKYKRQYTRIRALACFCMSSLCDITQEEICEVIGNITQSGVSYLTGKGLEMIYKDRSILENLIME